MASKHAEDAMINLEDLFMLSIDDTIDEKCLQLVILIDKNVHKKRLSYKFSLHY